MENINWDLYKDNSLKFMFDQASKMLDETFKSFRETTNRCYGALAIYITMASFCTNRIITDNKITIEDMPYTVLISGLIVSIVILWIALMPSNMTFPGAQPRKLIHEVFERYDSDALQMREYHIQIIKGYDKAIIDNRAQVGKRIDRFKNSIYAFLSSILISFLVAIII